MKIIVSAPVQLDSDEISKAITPTELGSLISDLANRLVKDTDFHKRRAIAGQMMDGISEEALCLLAEVVALGYHNSKVWATVSKP